MFLNKKIINCTKCTGTMTEGQAKATLAVYGSRICVRCVEAVTKFDSIPLISLNVA